MGLLDFPWLTEAVKKRALRYLLQRYMGHFLAEKLSLEQLSIDLYDGKGCIRDLTLDVDGLNDELVFLPFRFTSGCEISEISCSVPWSSLTTDSCSLEIQGATFFLNFCSSKDEDDHLYESSYLSKSMMSSSMQMAEEIASEYDRERENSNSGSSFEGLEMMAQLIDSVLRRVKVVATDTRIIMKSASSSSSRQTPSPNPSPESGSSIEFKIKRLMCEEDGIDQNIGNEFKVNTPGNIDKRLTLEGVEVAINGRLVSKIGGKHLIQIKASQDKSDLQIFLASPLLAVISSHELKSFFDVFNTPPVPEREPLCGQHRFGSKPMTQEHFFNLETILQQDAQMGQHQPMAGLHNFHNYGHQNLMTGAGSPLHSQNRWSDGLHQQDKQFHPLTDSVMTDDSIAHDRRSRTNSRVEHSGSSNFSCFIKIPGIYLCLLQKSDQQSLPSPVIPLIQVEFEKINQFLNDIVKDRNHIRLIAFPIHLNISKTCINAIIGDAMLIEKSSNNTELPLFWSESQDKHITSPKYRCEFRPNNSSSSSSPSSTVVHIEGHETTCLTIDPTILERLHEYISDLTDNNTNQSLNRNSSSGLEFEIKSRLLKINLLFPIPDLREEDETTEVIGSSLRSDAVMFVVEEVLITTNRRCTKAVFDDLKAILNEKGKEPVIFLEATRNPVDQIEVLITNGPASICINDEDDPESFLYSDMGDSVYYSNMNHREKTTAFRVKKKLISSSSGESENESVIGPSDRENTVSFVNQAKACTGFQIEIHIPCGNLALDQKQLDLIYNRFGNDLVFWTPKDLKRGTNVKTVREEPIVNVYKPCVSALAASTESVDSDSSFHSTGDAAGLTQIKNQCVVVVEVDELSVSSLNAISGSTDQRIRGQKVSLNVVVGLEDEKKTVIFLNGEKASFTHMKDTVIQCNHLDGDETNNNVDLTFEIHKMIKDFKKIKIAIGIENAALLKSDADIFKQFWDFINVTDEPVLGYVAPSVTTELHISLVKGVILLESSETRPALVTFDHLYITSRVVKQNCETLLRIRLEEGSIYFSKSLKSYSGFSPLAVSASCSLRSIRDYVCILDSGLTELSVKIKDEGRFELNVSNNVINMRVCSDSLSALCQMIVHFASTKQQANSSSSLESLDAAATENHVTEFDVSDVQAGLEDREEDLLRDAIDECSIDDGDKVSIRSCENCDSMGRQASDESGFWILGDDDVGTGITASTEPVIRKLTNDPILLKENHFSSSRSRPLPEIIKETVQRFMLEQLTIICNFYAGKDFNDEVSEGSSDSLRETPGREEKEDSFAGAKGFHESSKGLRVTFKDDPESEPQVNLWESLNLVSGADTAFNNRKDPNESASGRRNSSFDGGKGRQNDVCVQLYLSKIKSLFETFEPNFNVSWRFVFMVQDIEIKDKVSHSRINKMLYEYCSESMPRRNHVNMISVKATSRKNPDDNNDECEMKVSAKPLRINIDQDTLMFLIDFFTSISAPGAAFPSHPTSAASHSPRSVSQTSLDKVSEPDSTSDGEKDEESDAVSKNLPASSSTPKGSRKGSISSSVSRPPVLYVKSFIFSPDVPIRLDYQGKRLDFEKGALAGILMGLAQLNQSELRLKRLHNKHGILGIDRVLMYALQEWTRDIKRHQLPSILGAVGPMHSVIQLFQGIRDLFWMPIDQYRKDKRLVRGFQRGAYSFSSSTAMALIDLTNRVFNLIQNTAQFAHDVVSVPHPSIRSGHAVYNSNSHLSNTQPRDLREGMTTAYAVMKDGLKDGFKENFRHVTQAEDMTGAIGAVVRELPSGIFLPFIHLTQASSNVLVGIRNQLAPDARKEDQDKYKYKSSGSDR